MITLNAANNAYTQLASDISSSSTTITVIDSSKFPNPPFMATLTDNVNFEIIKVTGVSNNVLTVVRAQEGTTARAWNAGTTVELRFTAGMYNEVKSEINETENEVNEIKSEVNDIRQMLLPSIPMGSIAYFRKTLIDEINGITPDSYSDSTITAYGLRIGGPISNLVVTERTDDVPFLGVASFAIEEGTTNLVSSDFTTWTKNGTPTVTLNNTNNCIGVAEYKLTNTTDEQQYLYVSLTATSGTKYTFSCYFRKDPGTNNAWMEVNDGALNQTLVFNPVTGVIVQQPSGATSVITDCKTHYRVALTVTAQSTSITAQVGAFYGTTGATGKYVIISAPQVEAKPFATSFVVGRRPLGILTFTNPPLPLDNFVINFWFKAVRYPTQTNKWVRLVNVSYNASSFRGLEIGAPYYNAIGISTNTLALTVRRGGADYTRYSLGFSLYNEINTWHMLTFISTGNVLYVYIDGNLKTVATNDITRSLIESIVFGRYFGDILGTGTENGFLLSNVLFASYDSSVWTDSYIQFLYASQKCFYV